MVQVHNDQYAPLSYTVYFLAHLLLDSAFDFEGCSVLGG